jgi:hypothetical protein
VKHDIFFSDVNSCFSALKKAISEMRATKDGNRALQMGNPNVRSGFIRPSLPLIPIYPRYRPDTINVAEDPGMGLAFEFGIADVHFIIGAKAWHKSSFNF